MRVFHLCFFGKGHIYPTIPIAAELLDRGVQVTSYGLAEHRQIITASGAEFRPYPKAAEREKSGMQLTAYQTEWAVELLPGLLADVERERPDAIITDSMLPLGWYLARLSGLLLVVTTSHAVAREDVVSALGVSEEHVLGAGDTGTYARDHQRFVQATAALQSQFDITPLRARDTFQIPGDLTLVTTSRALQPQSDLLDESYKFIGPIIQPRQDTWELPFDPQDDKVLIYVSLGTMYHDPGVFHLFPEAFADGNYRVIISSGGQPVNLGDLPEDVLSFDYVPQLDLLPHVDVFVTHGGWNSVNEALYNSVPMVVCPQGKDQFMNAMVVEQVGAGIALPELRSGKLRAAVDAVRNEQRYRQRASEIGASLRTAGGAGRAADEIIALISG